VVVVPLVFDPVVDDPVVESVVVVVVTDVDVADVGVLPDVVCAIAAALTLAKRAAADTTAINFICRSSWLMRPPALPGLTSHGQGFFPVEKQGFRGRTIAVIVRSDPR
jgi:hypothetical protein